VEENTFDAQVTWVQGLQFVGRAATPGPTVVFDGEAAHGGSDCGLRPVAALLSSLAACTGMDVISILQKKRQRVTGLTINVKATRAEEYPKAVLKAELEYVVRGYDVAPEAVARAIELSQTKYCAVAASLKGEVVTTYRIEPETV